MNDTKLTSVTVNGTKYVPVSAYADTHNVRRGAVRRAAKRGDIAAVRFGNQWLVDANGTVPEPRHRTARADGRQRYIVYATSDEIARVAAVVGNDNVVDPREMARARRAAKRDANGNDVK